MIKLYYFFFFISPCEVINKLKALIDNICFSRWALRVIDEDDPVLPLVSGDHTTSTNRTDDAAIHGYFMRYKYKDIYTRNCRCSTVILWLQSTVIFLLILKVYTF